MPDPIPLAGPVDLDALDAFLISGRAPEGSMGLSDLDGFLAGIAAGPELVVPSEWLPVVWGGEEPAFESIDEARDILGTITGRYNEVVRALGTAPDDFDPVFWEGPEGEAIVTDWAAGFLDAVLLRPKAWEPLVRHSEASALILPLLALGADDPERLPFGIRPPAKDEAEALRGMAADLIPDCVAGIHGFWRERRARAAAGERTPSGRWAALAATRYGGARPPPRILGRAPVPASLDPLSATSGPQTRSLNWGSEPWPGRSGSSRKNGGLARRSAKGRVHSRPNPTR